MSFSGLTFRGFRVFLKSEKNYPFKILLIIFLSEKKEKKEKIKVRTMFLASFLVNL